MVTRLCSYPCASQCAVSTRPSLPAQQPFGVARQHLNSQLARRRASQLEHVQLAKIFARMGYPEAAAKQADIVPTASASVLASSFLRALRA